MEVAEFSSLTTTKPPVSETGDAQPESTGIQQAAWQFNPKPTPATQRALVQQTQAVVRDDAPSPMLVVGCLIGFGLLSIAVCVSTLPHYWFHRGQFAGRVKGSRPK
jgi:hypothetical protein